MIPRGDEVDEKTQIMESIPVEKPYYGLPYLPRKFKGAVAFSPRNDVTLFAHCTELIAIVVHGKLLGSNMTVGGGLGCAHDNQKTHSRLVGVIGFCRPLDAEYVCGCIVTGVSAQLS